MSDNTPMMKQYMSIKEQHKDAVLFFRMGDFYEMFKTDAVEVSRELNLTLTKRNGISMCGIPYHAATNYIGRLLKAGKKIAICEQTELPEKGKGIAKREVVEIITPGTIVDENFLDKKSNNYLAIIAVYQKNYSFSYIDLSTGQFNVTSLGDEHIPDKLKKELFRLTPGELLVQEKILEDSIFQFIHQGDYLITPMEDWRFDLRSSISILNKQFSTVNLKGFGFQENDPMLVTPGVLLSYIEDTSKSMLPHIRSLKSYGDEDYLSLDEATQKNLELVKNLQSGNTSFTLLEVLDETSTSMGGRLLRSWILHPLQKVEEITLRQRRVSCLYKEQRKLLALRDLLKELYDIERLAARVAMDRAHAKDLLSLKISLFQYSEILKLLEQIPQMLDDKTGMIFDPASLKILEHELAPVVTLLEKSIKEDPSILLSEGKLIKKGYNNDLDELREIKNSSKQVLKNYLEEEKDNSGISNLKLKYNRILGHFFEVSKINAKSVPPHFIRRQSLVNGERFTTERLGGMEVQLNTASDNMIELERNLFLEIRDSIKGKLAELQAVSLFFAELDTYQSLAYVATLRGYNAPIINDKPEIDIIMGRHPVVEAHLPPGEFVPNDSKFDDGSRNFSLITGPNMAGKSTYLRQNALLILMAQVGSYIPAQEAVIGVVDKNFCRVGASDNLTRGESTFLVEMNETANILRNSTAKSLIIMDEVGRGTSTEDGLSIAWAISEYLMDRVFAKTLFATHYHELTQLDHPKCTNLSLDVKEDGNDIYFLKRVIDRPSNNSYGIHVASLAGIPEEVILRARAILKELEGKKEELFSFSERVPSMDRKKQYALFEEEDLIKSELKGLKLDKTTPLEALNLLDRWKKSLLEE
ncbi:MAG: DNA mismatch repair protein MutS [Spirochaetaceae bacterium]|jgi:DNA mismatch repair protein MutS|nr:DNA mismatch repair protein MutS [Spirochaetaceae bacterium]